MAKKALLVGINDYNGRGDLKGCVNDILDMHFTLGSVFDFVNEEVRVLTDRRATSEAIKHRLNWLVKDAKDGDYLVFHYSGHGSQIRDRNGDEELSDGMDELICPFDLDWNDRKTYITDDDLNEIFNPLPAGVLLEVFLDCCHSGTGLKEMGLAPPPEMQAENPTYSRFLQPPADLFLRSYGVEDKLKLKSFLGGAKKRNGGEQILWAGCMAEQTSADAYIHGRYHGAFTYYYNVHIRRDPTVSRDELLRKVRASLRHNAYSQIPQLEYGATERDRSIYDEKRLK